MSRRSAAQRRLLRLWTAACLAALLGLGIARLGDWSLQWPVLLVPALWALPALLPRRRTRAHREDEPSSWDQPDHRGEDGNPYRPPTRTDTVEAPRVRDERYRRPG